MKPQLIGIGGALAAGKDTVADQLVAEYGFVKYGMSDLLHTALLTLNQWINVPVSNALIEPLLASGQPQARVTDDGGEVESIFMKYADITAAIGYVAGKEIHDYREALQFLGTEVARKQWNENFWVDLVSRRIARAHAQGLSVALTGVRYSNEAQMVTSMDGTLWYVDRAAAHGRTSSPTQQPPAGPHAGVASQAQAGSTLHMHSSETSIDGNAFDVIVRNDGTLAQLSQTVRQRYADTLTR